MLNFSFSKILTCTVYLNMNLLQLIDISVSKCTSLRNLSKKIILPLNHHRKSHDTQKKKIDLLNVLN